MDQVKLFKGCLPQILIGPFLNTLSQMILTLEWALTEDHFLFKWATVKLTTIADRIIHSIDYNKKKASQYIK